MSSPYHQQHFDDGAPGGMQPRLAFPPLTPMVKRLVVINFSIYVISLLAYLAVKSSRTLIVDSIGLAPGVWQDLAPFLPVWQVGTYGFVHDLGPWHLLMNMLGLYFFGTMVEGAIGSTRFLVHYVAAIVAGGIAFLLVGLTTDMLTPVVGASGGVLAMIVAAACFRPNQTVILLLFPIPLKWLAAGIVGVDFINGALSWRQGGGGGGTSHLVHLVGAAYGFLAVRQRWIWFDPVQRLQVRRAIADEEKRQSDAQRMDALLEKIHKEGINSLDRREREFLKRVSSKR